jgi:peptidoglycan hydrolase-like protein with peptidoglycan-binding domain
MVGRDVRHLQLRLAHLGFLHAPATARFGSLTRTAVLSYQRSRCLHADGVAGAATLTALRSGAPACSRGRPAPAPARGESRSAYLHSQLGTRTLARGMAGSDVRTLQRLLGVSTTGLFGAQTQAAVRRFQARSGLGADGAVGPATRTRLVAARMRPRMATYYGPGLYGRRTACGLRLTSRLVGVAHRRLPCGATVTIFYGGRFATLRVVDRGPYTSGVTFDLTAAAARRLGMRTTATLRAAY